MLIHLVAVGNRMPAWVVEGYGEYARRLNQECRLVLREVEPARRPRRYDPAQCMEQEADRVFQCLPKAGRIVALEIGGKAWNTNELALRLKDWLSLGADVALLVGGPDGLAQRCLERADEAWSLSRLTLPHPLVRVLVAEQLYRAWSLLHNHPYHR